jgi:uncharacterized membrane protein (DUF485 family)
MDVFIGSFVWLVLFVCFVTLVTFFTIVWFFATEALGKNVRFALGFGLKAIMKIATLSTMMAISHTGSLNIIID